MPKQFYGMMETPPSFETRMLQSHRTATTCQVAEALLIEGVRCDNLMNSKESLGGTLSSDRDPFLTRGCGMRVVHQKKKKAEQRKVKSVPSS